MQAYPFKKKKKQQQQQQQQQRGIEPWTTRS